MFIFLKIGFRNLFRNKRRSLLTSTVIGFGLASMILIDGFMEGMTENMIHSITNGLISEGQIHHPHFNDTLKIENTINNESDVESVLKHEENIEAFTKRTLGIGIVNSPRNSQNITIIGIDPSSEIHLSNINRMVTQGRFVQEPNDLLVGDKLMQHLEIKLGDKVVLISSEAHTGELVQDLYRITGVYKSGANEFDKSTIFMDIHKTQEFLKLGSEIHEIALKFRNRSISETDSYSLWEKIKETNNLGQSWKKIMSSFVNMMSLMKFSKAFTAGILIILIAFGIINTMFMALYERMFEFAVLQSLGTQKKELFVMIVSEAFALGLLGILVGYFITLVFAIPMTLIGIDYGGMEFAEVTIREPIYYEFFWYQVIAYPLLILGFTVLVSFYPAFHAIRLTMAKAIKRTL